MSLDRITWFKALKKTCKPVFVALFVVLQQKLIFYFLDITL